MSEEDNPTADGTGPASPSPAHAFQEGPADGSSAHSTAAKKQKKSPSKAATLAASALTELVGGVTGSLSSSSSSSSVASSSGAAAPHPMMTAGSREFMCQHDSHCNEPRTTKDRGGGLHVFCVRHKEEKQKAWREAAKRYRERKRQGVHWQEGGGGNGAAKGGGHVGVSLYQPPAGHLHQPFVMPEPPKGPLAARPASSPRGAPPPQALAVPPPMPPAGWPSFWFQSEMLRYVDMETRQLIKLDFDNFSQGRPGFRGCALQHRFGYELNAAPERYCKPEAAGTLGVKLFPVERFEWFNSLLEFLARQWWDTGMIMMCEQIRKDEGPKERRKAEQFLAAAGTTVERRKKVLLALIGSVHLRSYNHQEKQPALLGPKYGHMMMLMNIHGNGSLVFRQRTEKDTKKVCETTEEKQEAVVPPEAQEDGGGKEEDGDQKETATENGQAAQAPASEEEEEKEPEENGPEVLRVPLKSGDVFVYTGDFRYACASHVELESEYRCLIALRLWLPGREWLVRTVDEGGGFAGYRRLDEADRTQDMLWRGLPDTKQGLVAPSYAFLTKVLAEADNVSGAASSSSSSSSLVAHQQQEASPVGEKKEEEEEEKGSGQGEKKEGGSKQDVEMVEM